MKFKNLGIFMLCVAMLVGAFGSVGVQAGVLSEDEDNENIKCSVDWSDRCYFYGVENTLKGIGYLYAAFEYKEPSEVWVHKEFASEEAVYPYGMDTDVYVGGVNNQYAYVEAEFEFDLNGVIMDINTLSIHCDVCGDLY